MAKGETQLAGYFEQYEPAIARLGKALHRKLRARLPGLFEVVYLYERQGSLVISFSPTGKGYEALCTLALYPDGVKLFLPHVPAIAKADANKMLKGGGKKVRYLLLESATDLDRPEIEALMAAAINHAKLHLVPNSGGAVIIKAEAQKLRSSRTKQK